MAQHRRRARVCWAIIVGWWILLSIVRVTDADTDSPTAPNAVLPPWWGIFACAGAALVLAAVVRRRGRACMRLRPRLSHPSLYGSVYLEGFALKCLLGAAAMGVLYGIDWDWDSLFWQLLLWFEALNLRDVIAAMYVLVRVGSLRVPCAEWGMQTGRGVLRELSIGLVAGLLIWSLWRLPRTFADPGASDFLPRYVLDTVVFTPIFEELLYRGLLYRYLRDRMRWLPAAIASSVVFALMHDASRMPLAYVSGIVYALLREWRRSLIAPIAAHASWNLLSTAASGLFCD